MLKVLAIAALILPSAASANNVLFVGNSFTYGANSPAHFYKSNLITDLNGPGPHGETVGGVPAMFAQFSKESGLNYTVFAETASGKGLGFHYDNERSALNRVWDVAILQDYSVLDEAHPGASTSLVVNVKKIARLIRAKNPNVKIWLDATWSRADLTFVDKKSPWFAKPIQQMAKDISAGYEIAANKAHAAGVLQVGLAWNRAIDIGLAGANPYVGIPAGKIDLWSWDCYHASVYGYYLEALTTFSTVTGTDPLTLGKNEIVADDLGFSRQQTRALEQIVHDQLYGFKK